MCVYKPRALLVSVKTREGTKSCGTDITDGCELPCGCWELNLAPLGRAATALNHRAISLALYHF